MGCCFSKEKGNADQNEYCEIPETGPMTGKTKNNQNARAAPSTGPTIPERYIKDPSNSAKKNKQSKKRKISDECYRKGRTFTALFNYQSRNDDELSFDESDILIYQAKQDNMLKMKLLKNGKVGLVHHPYVEPKEAKDQDTSDSEDDMPQITDDEKIILQRQGKRVYKAIHPHSAEEEMALTAKEGDIFIVSMQQDDWYLAQNYETKEYGYIPCSCVEEINSIKTFGWYHEGIPRKEAERRLKQPKYPNKSFIVTERTDSIGSFTLSYKTKAKNGQIVVRHENIRTNGFLRESTPVVFPTLEALVDAFIDEHQAQPCPKPQPTIMALNPRDDEWQLKKETLDFQQPIGKGQFGEVYRGVWKGKHPVAIKAWKEDKIDQEAFHKEVNVMKEFRHENLVKLLGICTEESYYYIVTELLEKGSLKDVLTMHGKSMSIDRKLEISMKISDGMAYIEGKRFVHRDLAARNILIGAEDQVKIGDFGMARILSEGAYTAPLDTLLPVRWCAPEILTNYKYSTKSDVWAYGITLYEIFTDGATPYGQGVRNTQAANKIKGGVVNPQPPDCPDYMYNTMLKCWEMKPEERPTFFRIQEALYNAVNYDGMVFQDGEDVGQVNPGFDIYEDTMPMPSNVHSITEDQPVYDDTLDDQDVYDDTHADPGEIYDDTHPDQGILYDDTLKPLHRKPDEEDIIDDIYDEVETNRGRDVNHIEIEVVGDEEDEDEVVENLCCSCKRMKKDEDIDFGIYWHRCQQCDRMYHRICIPEDRRPGDNLLDASWFCDKCY